MAKKSKRRLLPQSKKPIQGLTQRIRWALSKCRKVGAKNWVITKKATGGLVLSVDNPKRPAQTDAPAA